MSVEKYRNKFSGWDFSEYNYTTEVFKNEDGKEIRVDKLKDGDSSIGYIIFVNNPWGLTVHGDFGNWMFCRQFVPSECGYVSEMYWNEKLQINSTQKYSEYSPELTEELLNECIESTDSYNSETIEFFKHLLQYTDDEIEYTYEAFRTYQSNIDYDDIPIGIKVIHQLRIVFDAFNEMCRRHENKN